MLRSVLLFISCILIFFSCAGPDKLLEKNRPEAAFDSILRMNSKQALKWYPELINSFEQLQLETSEKLNTLIGEAELAKWPHIYSSVARGLEREQKLLELLERQGEMKRQNFTFHPEWQNLFATAQEKSAEYYYQRMLAEKKLGDDGDKKAYRSAYRLANRVENYIANYNNVQEELEELKILGTDYVVIYPDFGPNYENPEWLWNDFVVDAQLPWTADWLTVHYEEKRLPRTDYYLRSGIDNISVSPNIENTEICTNSTEVKVGTKKVKEWSVQDSAYVEVEVDIYETVSITITNVYQQKNSTGELNLALIPVGDETPSTERDHALNACWTNKSGTSCGDYRAAGGACTEEIGIYCGFPSSYEMVILLEHRFRAYVKEFVSREFEVRLDKRRRNWGLFGL